MDPAFNDMDGIELIRQFTRMRPRSPILVVSAIDAHDYLPRIFRAGARGFLPKTTSPKRLLAAMRRILAGHRVFPFPGTGTTLRGPGKNGMGVLSDRELELFRFLGKGFTTQKIAEVMQLSEHTVHIYRLQIKNKLGLGDLSRLTQQAILWEDQQH
jgi:DNA-binding NarL/FixJ family response regulator